MSACPLKVFPCPGGRTRSPARAPAPAWGTASAASPPTAATPAPPTWSASACPLSRYSTVQYSTVQYSAVQYSTVQYSTVQCNTVQSRHTEPILDVRNGEHNIHTHNNITLLNFKHCFLTVCYRFLRCEIYDYCLSFVPSISNIAQHGLHV